MKFLHFYLGFDILQLQIISHFLYGFYVVKGCRIDEIILDVSFSCFRLI